MEKTIIQEKNTILNEKITLINRNHFAIEGVKEVISSNENGIYLKVQDNHMTLIGNNIHIEKLDIPNQILECTGQFECVKYGKCGNIFKRIFK
jgi:hypothetical protein